MSVLAADRNTFSLSQGPRTSYKVKGSTLIYAGALVAVTALGYLVPAANTAGLVAVGRAAERADNSAGADGDISCLVDEGIYGWDNAAGGAAVGQAEMGHVVYVSDDHTVTKTAGNGVRAGIARRIDADYGVFVETRPVIGAIGATGATGPTGPTGPTGA